MAIFFTKLVDKLDGFWSRITVCQKGPLLTTFSMLSTGVFKIPGMWAFMGKISCKAEWSNGKRFLMSCPVPGRPRRGDVGDVAVETLQRRVPVVVALRHYGLIVL